MRAPDDKAFREALELVLTEFGSCDLDERIKYFESYEGDYEGEGQEQADALYEAFDLVWRWLKGTSWAEFLEADAAEERD